MAYSKKVIDYTRDPKHVGSLDATSSRVGTGMVGAPACGDVMRLQIEVDEQEIIQDAKFKTYGCGSAIASSALATEWLIGRSLSEAAQLRNTAIAAELELPPIKRHCSLLAEDAVQAAIEDYRKKQGS